MEIAPHEYAREDLDPYLQPQGRPKSVWNKLLYRANQPPAAQPHSPSWSHRSVCTPHAVQSCLEVDAEPARHGSTRLELAHEDTEVAWLGKNQQKVQAQFGFLKKTRASLFQLTSTMYLVAVWRKQQSIVGRSLGCGLSMSSARCLVLCRMPQLCGQVPLRDLRWHRLQAQETCAISSIADSSMEGGTEDQRRQERDGNRRATKREAFARSVVGAKRQCGSVMAMGRVWCEQSKNPPSSMTPAIFGYTRPQ